MEVARGATAVERIEALLHDGSPWAAVDLFRAVADHDDDPELRYWGALAHARSGATHEARLLLDSVRSAPGVGAALLHEALCLSGRLWKDRIDRDRAMRLDLEAVGRSREEYLQAFALAGDSYPGANAATLSMLLGEDDDARALASRLVDDLNRRAEPLGAWQHAALGESLLLLGRIDEARRSYEHACAAMGPHPGNVATMRRQLRLLGRVLPAADDVLDVLPGAQVIAFAGHLVDVPGHAGAARFPESLVPAVSAALRDRLAAARQPVVYTSAACGADLLFIEAALDLGAEVNVVLPFDRADFVGTSVGVGGERWVARFDDLLARVDRVVFATEESHLGDDVLFENAVFLIEGLAILRASQLESEATLLCVLDQDAQALPGGTRAAHDRWVRYGGTADVIDLRTLRHAAAGPASSSREAPVVAASPLSALALSEPRPHRTLKVMLFADIAGYGRVHDAAAPLFQSRFLRLIADQIAGCAVPPLETNTWGDALYAVFEEPVDGAEFALGLLERVEGADWSAAGLSGTSRIRIALHAGPVFCGFDPIRGRDNHFGSSVTRTARIEPVTPAGMIYASESFIATLASYRPRQFAFEYVGNLKLAKAYGESRLYRLERRVVGPVRG